ncbi:hypothetical protein SAMN04488543_0648 [Friedmanniella luteola]|uniref:Anti-sigma-K factor rskA n=1 Tax=Friedmanniella luteola TaxID=546871 RepID=A0A1H1MJ06_9ACTN|nr:hypothetical protein [Friedmanniella luteola]SDR86647.1 hypothetical protein SAMN04488543_0648 [Friedmanniella luteola]
MHVDPELLVLLALGEDVGTADERRHAQSCPACADELADLHRVATVGRGARDETRLVSPGPDVWARVRAELGLDRAPEPSLPPTAHARPGHDLRAHARLTPVEATWSQASGRADLATDERGRRVLQVALHADLPSSGIRQAWLVHRLDPSRRQTLGILDGRDGLWTVDHSIDLQEYAILDISQQGTGETEHSGQTIVRGELTLVG